MTQEAYGHIHRLFIKVTNLFSNFFRNFAFQKKNFEFTF